MLERIGKVLYWIFSSIAVLFLLLPCGVLLYAALNGFDNISWGDFLSTGSVLLVLAFISWIIGKALRYVFSGY